MDTTNFRSILQHQRLRDVYRQYLQSSVPKEDGKGRTVAGEKVRNGLAFGDTLMGESKGAWDAFVRRWEENPSSIWIWSDLHLNHKNISSHAGRPFDNVMYMNQTMLSNAQCVENDDLLLFVGDVSFFETYDTKMWLHQCPGQKYLILGNHDIDRSFKTDNLRSLPFQGIAECFALNKDDTRLWFTHYPIAQSFLPERTINIHGHTHQINLDGPYINVCVEQLNYSPKRLVDLLEHIV